MTKESEVDFLGNTVRAGDYIAFARNPYSTMLLGKIIGFTAKGIKVIRKNRNGKWNSKWAGNTDKEYETILPYQFVKIDYKEEIE